MLIACPYSNPASKTTTRTNTNFCSFCQYNGNILVRNNIISYFNRIPIPLYIYIIDTQKLGILQKRESGSLNRLNPNRLARNNTNNQYLS